MNAEQFVQFISEAATLNTPPSNPFREDWDEIRKAIKPHFYGSSPDGLSRLWGN